MSTAIKRRRGSTAQHAAFTGQLGEVTIDTSKKVAVVHDGATVGGFPMAREHLLDIRLFGAVGDNATDCTAAIQAALDFTATSIFKVVHIPSGNFKTGKLTVPSGITFSGNGEISVLVQNANDNVVVVNHASNVTLRNFKVSGNRVTFPSTSANGILVDWIAIGGTNVAIENVTVTEVNGAGIIALGNVTTPSTFLSITNCTVLNTGTHGVISQDYISDVQIIRNRVSNSGLAVASRPLITASRSGSRVIVSGNIVKGSAAASGDNHGISLDKCSDVVCADNVISLVSTGIGIEVGFLNNATVQGNIIRDTPGGPAIGVSGNTGLVGFSSGVTISNNTIDATCNTGIRSLIDGYTGAVRHANFTICGNTIRGTTVGPGLQLQYIDSVCVTGNMIYGTKASGIYCIDNLNEFIGGNTVINCNIQSKKTVTSLTRAVGTATAVCPLHGFANGAGIRMVGAVSSQYNGYVIITVVDANTFTYAVETSADATAVGTIEAIKANDDGDGGIRSFYFSTAYKDRRFLGVNCCERNGAADVYPAANSGGFTGYADHALYLRTGKNPTSDSLTSGLSANILDRAAIYVRNKQLVIAYNNAGAVTYIKISLDGADTTFTHDTTPP